MTSDEHAKAMTLDLDAIERGEPYYESSRETTMRLVAEVRRQQAGETMCAGDEASP